MKITNKIEQLFTHAVALNQSGRLRNTIYCIENEIYIQNSDNMVLLRFEVGQDVFDEPVSFRANDYESQKFYVKEGKIVFETREQGFVRRKSCGVPEANPEDIKAMFEELSLDDPNAPVIRLNKVVLGQLDDDLSHIEFSGTEEHGLQIVQRNIYDGSIVTVTRENKGIVQKNPDQINKDFGPIGIRTNDFFALFTFFSDIEFTFTNWGYASFQASKGSIKMQGMMGWCLYDEMGVVESILEEVIKDGREEPEIRDGEPETRRTSHRTKQKEKTKSRRTK